MSIHFFEEEKVFKLDTSHTSYLIGLIGEENLVAHIYYGKRIKSHKLTYLLGMGEPVKAADIDAYDRVIFMGAYPKEYATHGFGDYKESSIEIVTEGGHTALNLCYKGHRIIAGKPGLKGLPATFASEKEAKTLILACVDEITGISVELSYTVFEDCDVIARSAKIINVSKDTIWLNKALSTCVDMPNKDFDIITLHGDWAKECHINRYPLTCGTHNVNSISGRTSADAQPFMALASHNTDEDLGEVYGMNLVYSGNFLTQTSLEPGGMVRFTTGIHPQDFKWKLDSGDEFQTPEAVLSFSTDGIGQMTRNFHDLYRKHLIQGDYAGKKRPILINNWEATYFNFTTSKLLDIAREASKVGIEMLVMDDGWFGKRNDDRSSLGDWFVNEDKLPGGLSYLVDEVNKLGMKFGIWVEPEMVSPDSELYRKHPDWAIALPGRKPGLRRNQYVLDFSRQEVVDGIYEMLSKVLHSANIEYVKWDMNRPLCDLGSLGLPAERQGELNHRYVLGLYQMQERMLSEFPHLLLENCASGGSRFDAGMLYYSPQIWTSDDTDAIERLIIQEGCAILYPLSCMGAHVSDCPNHITGRQTPFSTRGIVAMAGTFGYELDVTKISEEEKNQIPKQVSLYHKYHDLVSEGDYYRIASYRENHVFDCYMVVAKDKAEALVTYVHVNLHPGEFAKLVKLKGLEPEAEYEVELIDCIGNREVKKPVDEKERTYTGEELMYGGYRFQTAWAGGDNTAKMLHIIRRN